MPIVRIIYEKKSPAKFISANYISKIFERSLRRLYIPLEFSSGYTHRVKMSLGPPLAVGISGTNEVIDVHLVNRQIESCEIVENLNKILPDGLKVIDCYYLKDNEKSPPAIKSACYTIKISDKKNFEILESWKIIFQSNEFIEIEIPLEKLKHKQLFEIFGSNNVISRRLIFL